MLLAFWGLSLALPASAAPSVLLRDGAGAWVALGEEDGALCAWRAGDPAAPDLLETRVVVAGAGDAALTAEGVVRSPACVVSGSDELHLVWANGGKACYARCALARIGEKDAWQGADGQAGAETVAPRVLPSACALAAGARPMIAGTRDGAMVVFRFDGEWRETLTEFEAHSPVLARDGRRGLHLAFAARDGIVYQRTDDGARWRPREVILPGRVDAGPVMALSANVDPVIAAVVEGRAVVSAWSGNGWVRWIPSPAPDAGSAPPSLVTDRSGTVWCFWTSGGRIWAARWLGTTAGPLSCAGPADSLLVAEQEPPPSASDLGLLTRVRGVPQVVRVPVPTLSAADDHAVRFLDLLDVARVQGVTREACAPLSRGTLPPPASGDLLPSGILPWGKGGKGLRAWFSLREGDRWNGYSAEWVGRGWRPADRLRLSSPRPWLQAPAGMMSVVDDPEDPDPARRLKMLAERVGSVPALLTSSDGLTWGYYAELPAIRPLSFLRDLLAPADHRWRTYGMAGEDRRLVLLDSPDREHWYAGQAPCPALDVVDATFWVEDGLVLGLLNGGRQLVAGRTGDRMMLAAELPQVAGDGHGRAFAPPFQWNGRQTLCLAAPEGWRWMELPAGRWVGLRAEGPKPGICETVPIAAASTYGRRLLIDVATGTSGAVVAEVLGADGEPVDDYRAEIRRKDGWSEVRWGRKHDLWRIGAPNLSLRFTLSGEARLYGFRFSGGGE